jgi:hypothetical protein
MRFKLPLLSFLCALAFASCTSSSNTNQTTNAPTQTTTANQTVTTTSQPGASPQASGPQQTAANAPGATTSTQPISAKAKDACALLTSDDIKEVQGEEVKETKLSQRTDSSFDIAQCFYTTPTFTKSVSLEVTQAAPSSMTSPRQFWQENFARAAERSREKEKDKARAGRGAEEEEEGAPPQRVAGLGDDAYWVNSRVSGALYVLKGDRFIRLSLGGTDADAVRQKKIKTLAQKALSRL